MTIQYTISWIICADIYAKPRFNLIEICEMLRLAKSQKSFLSCLQSSVYHFVTLVTLSSCQPLFRLSSPCLFHSPVSLISVLLFLVLSLSRRLWDSNGFCHSGGCDKGLRKGGKISLGKDLTNILIFSGLNRWFNVQPDQ